MKVLELFAGSRSFGKMAESLGHTVFSVDIIAFENINLQKSVVDLLITDIPFVPDVIWASPVCPAWSKTGWFHFWDTNQYKINKTFVAKKDYANESVEMVRKTIEIFSWFPLATYFMENPEGMLYRHPVINQFAFYKISEALKRDKVTYCQYGLSVRKPTHIWNNCLKWIPKKACGYSTNCHTPAPRCTNKGTLNPSLTAYERSRVPEELCREILMSFLN